MPTFVVEGVAGEGAAGKVYRARDGLHAVALKFPKTLGDADVRFLREEVKVLSRLSHPGLVSLRGFFERYDPQELFDGSGRKIDEELLGRPFLAMEWVEGTPWDKLARDAGFARVLAATVQILHALHYLHARGVLHRDLKPSNLIATPDGRVRLLDFGLALSRDGDEAAAHAVGTPSVMAPEAFRGDAEERSDLFSLGCVLHWMLVGRYPYERPATPAAVRELRPPETLASLNGDVPAYFSSFVLWLLSLSPSDRPSSARVALGYLHRHAPELFADHADEPEILEKPPLIGRAGEISAFLGTLAEVSRSGCAGFLAVSGPAGVGRSRLVEEFKWKALLGGVGFRVFDAATAEADWNAWLEARGGLVSAAEGGAGGDAEVLCFSDLHAWPEEELQSARIFWILSASSRAPRLLLAEHDDGAMPDFLPELAGSSRLALADFGESESREFLERAAAGAKLKKQDTKKILEHAGGRPLLLLEGLRESLFGTGPSPRKHLATARLGEDALWILALIVSHPQTAPVDRTRGASGLSDDAFTAAVLELDRAGVIDVRSPSHPDLRLRHPALAESYRTQLNDDDLRDAHAAWLPHVEDSVTKVHHALAAGDDDVLVREGLTALDGLLAVGELVRASAIVERLRPLAPRLNRVWLHSHRAAIAYRLGRFDDALAAYDDWIVAKDESVDDGTGINRLRYRFSRGLVLLAAGRKDEAERELRGALELGRPSLSEHRPRLARAHLLLGTLLKDRGALAEAAANFESARTLAVGDAVLESEALLRLGEIAHAENRYDAASDLFAASRAGGSPQFLSITWNAQALLDKDRGRLSEALAAAHRAEEYARASGDLLQWARCRGNLGLVLMESARYGEALEWIESTAKIARVLRNDADRLVIDLHRAELARLTGLVECFRAALSALSLEEVAFERHGLAPYLRLLVSEAACDDGRIDEGLAGFAGLSRTNAAAVARLRALRWRLLTGRHADAFFEDVPPAGSSASYWKALTEFFALPEAGAPEYRALAESVAACPWPELKIDLEILLSAQLKRRDLPALAAAHAHNAALAWRGIRDQLPEEMKMDYEKNRSLKALEDAASSQRFAQPSVPDPAASGISEQRFRQFCEINRQIAQKTELGGILERVLDAALELTGAERGFLVLRNDAAKSGPLKGFEIGAARHINQKNLAPEELQISMTVLKEAIGRGSPLITDNAQHDPRLKTQASVMQYRLSSILAVPFEAEGETVGALYLDHRGRADCFQQEHVTLLSGFASQVALAIQKARLIEELRKNNQSLEIKVKDLSEELKVSREGLRHEYKDIIGKSRPMVQVLQLIDRVAPTKIPVWIHGASGTGKELVARALHAGSPRKSGPFVAENCGAIAENLLESELFGHKKGAFTHADRDRTGLFEQASGGTLFLDEVADMPVPMQVKLLRALQEGEIRPLGANKTVKVDVRLVTASNQDLAQLVRSGKFRQDLFFRINGMTIPLPPLRDRKDDIPLLVRHFTGKIARDFDLKETTVTREALKKLMDHDWPGNIRELEAAVRNMLLFAQGAPVTPDMIPLQGAGDAAETEDLGSEAPRGSGDEHDKMVALLRKHHLDKKKVADELGVTLKTVYMRLGALKIPKKTSLLQRYLEKAG